MPDSPTTAMNVVERPWADDDFSRRSSLRSMSIYDFEGPHDHGIVVIKKAKVGAILLNITFG